MDKLKEINKFNIINILLFAAGSFLRIFRLDTIPIGVYVDEPPLAYNAWCIANYGTDRYLRDYPIYFQNWYSGQSPLYTYLLAALYKCGFKMGDVGVLRMPACILSIGIMIVALLVAKRLTDNQYLQTATLAFVALTPNFIMQGRTALDCNLLLFCVALSFLFLIKYVEDQKMSSLIVSGISFGISLYAYALSYILLSIFLVISALYLLWVKKLDLKKLLVWAAAVVVTGLPIILFAVSVLFKLDEYKFLGLTIAPVSAERMSELSGSNFIKNAIRSVLKSFTYDGQYALTIPETGTIYHLSIAFVLPGIILGTVKSVKSFAKRVYDPASLFVFLFLANLVVGGLNQDVFVYRVNSIFVSYAYFFTLALAFYFEKIKSARAKKTTATVLTIFYSIYVIVFSYYYLEMYNDIYPANLKLAGKEIRDCFENCPGSEVYVAYLGLPEYILFEFPIDPKVWNEQEHVNSIHSQIPEDISPDACYIVPKPNASVRELVENSGCDFCKEEYEYFYVYMPVIYQGN